MGASTMYRGSSLFIALLVFALSVLLASSEPVVGGSLDEGYQDAALREARLAAIAKRIEAAAASGLLDPRDLEFLPAANDYADPIAKRAVMRLGKRAMMRMGKRAVLRLG